LALTHRFPPSGLAKAYNAQFIGNAAINFIRHLEILDEAMSTDQKVYAKAISVVQSSGTGKSRMLTEVCPYDVI